MTLKAFITRRKCEELGNWTFAYAIMEIAISSNVLFPINGLSYIIQSNYDRYFIVSKSIQHCNVIRTIWLQFGHQVNNLHTIDYVWYFTNSRHSVVYDYNLACLTNYVLAWYVILLMNGWYKIPNLVASKICFM